MGVLRDFQGYFPYYVVDEDGAVRNDEDVEQMDGQQEDDQDLGAGLDKIFLD